MSSGTLATYWRRRARGTCATCSNPDPVKPPHVRCKACRLKDAALAKTRYWNLKQGLTPDGVPASPYPQTWRP